jgi:superfamily I DNA/RNA helicase
VVVVALADSYDTRVRMFPQSDATQSGFEYLAEFMETFGLHMDRVESLADRNSPTSRVNLMTVHASKGLEFDVVFVTGLEVRSMPRVQQHM